MKRLFLALLVLCTSAAAQTIDPSGHWEGTVEAPGIKVPLEVDLVRNPDGTLGAAINLPVEKVAGLPIKVTMEGRTIKLQARSDQSVVGTLSEDGSSIVAEFQMGQFVLPFVLRRTGAAKLAPIPTLAAVSPQLEGKWEGIVTINSTETSLMFSVANRPDNTAIANLINVSQGGLEIPVTSITQAGSEVNVELKVIGVSFAGALNADATELSGTYTQGERRAPLTLRRSAGSR
jgi:hypothetical protein